MTTVYLDTHHLSRVAAGQNTLKRFFQDSRFEFCFSIAHVVESLPKGSAPNADSISRLELMTGKHSKSLVGWGEIAELEKKGGATKLSDLIVDPELMLPGDDSSFDRSEVNKTIRDELKSLIKETILDPNLQRSALAKVFKHGRIRPEVIRLLRDRKANTAAEITSAMPDAESLLGSGGLYDFLLGKVSQEDFARNFRRALTNPATLGRLTSHPEMKSLQEFSKFFWIQTEELGRVLSKLAENLIVVQIKNGSFDYSRFRSEIRRFAQSDEHRYMIVTKLAGVEVTADDIKSMRGTRLFVDVFWEYVLEKMDQHANLKSSNFGKPVRFKRGDFADLVHLFYCPYVDIFGCDRAMRDRIRRAGWPIEKIVTNDSELEQAFENSLRVFV